MTRARTPGQRADLTTERIEDAAFRLIETEGLDAFSFRKLAAALGCKAMSIYHYFPSKAHLFDALIDRVFAELLPLPGGGRDWLEQLELAARRFRRVSLERPAFFSYVALHRLNTPTCLNWLDAMLKVFERSGLPREVTVRMFRSFGYYVIGALLDETAGYSRGPSAVNPPDDETLARDYPSVAAAAPFFRPEEFDGTFEFGLRTMLDGMRDEAGNFGSPAGGARREARKG